MTIEVFELASKLRDEIKEYTNKIEAFEGVQDPNEVHLKFYRYQSSTHAESIAIPVEVFKMLSQACLNYYKKKLHEAEENFQSLKLV